MTWVLKADLEVATDVSTALLLETATATRDALDARYLPWLNVQHFGAVGDGVTDDTAAIRAAVNALVPGQTLYFPPVGVTSFYLTSSQIDITTPNVRILGVPRDSYAVKIRCNTPDTIMFMAKTTGVVFEDIGLVGGGGVITGIEFWGDSFGNCDSRCDGVTFQGLVLGARTRGRNNTFTGECIFSTSSEGIVIDGPDATYHTGAGADSQMWGNTIVGCRFHGNGSQAYHGNIRITPEAKVLSAKIIDNEFDGEGKGHHILATGTAANPIQHLVMEGNTHNRTGRDAYNLTYVSNSTIDGANIAGFVGAWFSGHGVALANCDTMTVANVFGHNLGKSGIVATNTTFLRLRDSTFKTVGLDTAATYHGMDIDATNTLAKIDNVTVNGAPGWGFTGEPTASSMTGCTFANTTLGRINSSTLTNSVTSGHNTYVEGKFGRLEDVGRKAYDFTAATAKTVATVTAGSNLGSTLIEVEFTSRDGASGDCFVFAKRYVRMGNGTPVITTIGTDSVAAATITVAASGVAAVTVSITTTGTVYGSVVVRASAGGASSSSAVRGTIVAMA